MSDEVKWGDFDTEEEVTEDEVKDVENMSKRPIGKYLCTVVESKPKRRDPKEGNSYFVVGLKMRIDEALEIDNEPADAEESEKHEGKFLFDDVIMLRPDESDALKNRRVLILKRAGIISSSGGKVPSNAWSELIVGKQFKITYIDNYDKNSKKTYRQVAFDGYEVPEVEVNEDDLKDI